MPATDVKVLIHKVVWDDGDAKKKADVWDKKLEQTAKNATRSFSKLDYALSIGLTKALSLAGDAIEKLAGGVKSMVKDSISLEDALSGVKRTANLNEEQIETLTKAVRDLSSEELRGAVSAQNLGEILEVAGQRGELAGDKFEETLQGALRFTEQIALSAAALDLSFTKTATILGKLQTPWKENTVEVGYLANTMNVLADSTEAAADKIILIAQKAAPALASLKVSQADLLGFAAALDAMGMSAYTSSTALQRVFGELSGNTDAFAEAFGINVQKLNHLVQTDMSQAFQLFLQHVQKMAEESPAGMQKVSQALKDLGVSNAGVKTAILGLANLGPKLQSEFLDPANEGITNMNSINAEFINSITRVSQLWQALKTIWTNTAGTVSDMLLPLLRELLLQVNEQAIAFRKWFTESSFVKEDLPQALEQLQTYLSGALQQATAFVQAMDWSQIIQNVREFAKTIDFAATWDAIKTSSSSFFNFMTNVLPPSIAMVQSMITQLERLVEWFNQIKSTAEPAFKLLEIGFKQLEVVINAPIMAMEKLWNVAEKMFPDINQWVTDSISKLSELATALFNLIPGMKDVEKEAYGQSLFPNMVAWAEKTSQAVGGLQQSMAGLATATATASQGSETFLTKANKAINTAVQAASAPQIEKVKSFHGTGESNIHKITDPVTGKVTYSNIARETGAKGQGTIGVGQATVGQSTATYVTNVAFNGTNVVDHSSQTRFANNLSKIQKTQAAKVISAR